MVTIVAGFGLIYALLLKIENKILTLFNKEE